MNTYPITTIELTIPIPIKQLTEIYTIRINVNPTLKMYSVIILRKIGEIEDHISSKQFDMINHISISEIIEQSYKFFQSDLKDKLQKLQDLINFQI